MKFQNKQAFTILELIIVLLIMGLMYTLSITSFSKNTLDDKKLYFNMKSHLVSQIKKPFNTLEYIRFEDDTYTLLLDHKEVKSPKLQLPKEIEFFSYKADGELKEKFAPYYKNNYFKDVAFRFTLYPNGSSTKCIVYTDEKYYIQSAYFKDEKVFQTLQEAKEYLLLEIQKHSMVPVSE